MRLIFVAAIVVVGLSASMPTLAQAEPVTVPAVPAPGMPKLPASAPPLLPSIGPRAETWKGLPPPLIPPDSPRPETWVKQSGNSTAPNRTLGLR